MGTQTKYTHDSSIRCPYLYLLTNSAHIAIINLFGLQIPSVFLDQKVDQFTSQKWWVDLQKQERKGIPWTRVNFVIICKLNVVPTFGSKKERQNYRNLNVRSCLHCTILAVKFTGQIYQYFSQPEIFTAQTYQHFSWLKVSTLLSLHPFFVTIKNTGNLIDETSQIYHYFLLL